MKRRKNQPDIKHLSHISRFLSLVSNQRGLTQAELSKKLGNISTATISRWFRGDLKPSEEDRDRLAEVLEVTTGTLTALAILDESGKAGNMLPGAGTFGYLARGRTRLILLSGMSMIAGVPQLREVGFNNKTILLDLLDPLGRALEEFSTIMKINPSDLLYSWTAALSIVTSMWGRNKQGRVRLWIRDSLEVDQDNNVGQYAGNEWVVMESGLAHVNPVFKVRITGDESWQDYLGAYIHELENKDASRSDKRRLLWDSAWTKDDKRLIYFESEWLPKLHEKLASSRITLPQDK